MLNRAGDSVSNPLFRPKLSTTFGRNSPKAGITLAMSGTKLTDVLIRFLVQDQIVLLHTYFQYSQHHFFHELNAGNEYVKFDFASVSFAPGQFNNFTLHKFNIFTSINHHINIVSCSVNVPLNL